MTPGSLPRTVAVPRSQKSHILLLNSRSSEPSVLNREIVYRHHKIPVKTENWTGECLRQEVCMFLLRLYGDHVTLSPEYKLS